MDRLSRDLLICSTCHFLGIHELTLSLVDSSIFNFGQIRFLQMKSHSKIQNRIANSIEPDKTAHYEPSHFSTLFEKV